MAFLHSFTTGKDPVTVARAQSGELYICNGYDAVQRWDGKTATTEAAGIEAPAQGTFAAAGDGSGSLSGTYKVYCRFVDDEGIPGNFNPTPVSVTLASDDHIDYSNIPQPAGGVASRVKNIQLWRNTDGQEITWYLDGSVAVESPAVTTYASTNTDAQLQASTALRFLTADGYPNANRFGVPVATYKVVASFMDRMWYAGTTLTTAAARNTIMFSEATEPESVPSVNSLTLQEDGDDITGLMPVGPYLYILKRRHIYQLATAGDPRRDASVTLVADRGCINQRCWVRVEGTAFLLDENGIYVLSGGQVQAIDKPIRNYLNEQVDWTHASTFHASKDADQELVQFFVALGTDTSPRHALTYHYRLNRWSLESFAGHDVVSSGEVKINGVMRLVIGYDSAFKYAADAAVAYYDDMVPWTYTLGEFRLLPTSRDNVRRFTIWFDPVPSYTIYQGSSESSSSSSSAPIVHVQTINVKLYWNGSATAETPVITQDNEKGVSTVTGTAGYVIDLSNSEGYASFRFDGGLDTDAKNYRTVKFELSGNTSRPLNIHRIEIDGVQ